MRTGHLIVVVALSGACGGLETSSQKGNLIGEAGTAAAGTSTPGSRGTSACRATCGNPPGSVESFSSVAEVYAAMAGPWQICPGNGTYPLAPQDAIGVEFGPASSAVTAGGSTVGGKLYYLVEGPSGPTRGAGFDYQLAYDVSPEGGSAFQLNIHDAPNSGFPILFKYSSCPTELETQGDIANSNVIVVRFP